MEYAKSILADYELLSYNVFIVAVGLFNAALEIARNESTMDVSFTNAFYALRKSLDKLVSKVIGRTAIP